MPPYTIKIKWKGPYDLQSIMRRSNGKVNVKNTNKTTQPQKIIAKLTDGEINNLYAVSSAFWEGDAT
jgi:hypothetical protein